MWYRYGDERAGGCAGQWSLWSWCPAALFGDIALGQEQLCQPRADFAVLDRPLHRDQVVLQRHRLRVRAHNLEAPLRLHARVVHPPTAEAENFKAAKDMLAIPKSPILK